MKVGSIAPESEKIERARRKLLKQIERVEGSLTPENLQMAAAKIKDSIDRQGERVKLVGKTGLFDQGQNPARLSRKVAELAKSLEKGEGFNVS